MKKIPIAPYIQCGFAAIAASLVLLCTDAVAGEAPGDWRPLYDLVMRWVNFLILAFILVKFGKTPLMNFLRGQQEKIDDQIQRLEDEKTRTIDKIDETERILAESADRFETLTRRIVAQGEKKKQRIIEDAKQESRVLIEDARRKIGNRLLMARDTFRSELVDASIAIASERLVGQINETDNDKMIARFMERVGS